MRAASNPGGPGHGWVKKRFPIDGSRAAPGVHPGEDRRQPAPRRRRLPRVALRLGETLQKQLEDGDWDVAEGLAYRSPTST
jgi:hypothetical protein